MGSKVVNFHESFLCGFGPKIYQIWHRATSTPQKPKSTQIFRTNILQMRKKSKKPVGGVYSSQDWSQKKASAKRNCFYKRYILSKHPQIAKKLVQSLKNRNFCYFFKFLQRGFNPIKGGGGHNVPPLSRICVYASGYAYEGANFLWLFLIFSMEEVTRLSTQ